MLLLATLLAAGVPGIVVLDVDSRAISEDDATAVQARVARGVAEGRPAEQVVTTADLRALVDVAADRQALECDGSSACIAEIAGAFGAAHVVTTRINKLSNRYLIEVVLIDAGTASVIKRVDSSAPKKDLLDVARRLGREVVSAEMTSPLLIAGAVTAGVGALLGIGGGVGAWMAESAVQGRGVSAADKELGFNARVPLAGLAAVGVLGAIVGGGLAIAGALE